MEVLADQHCSFLGNVTVGKDVSLHRMQELYHAVMSGSLQCIDARLWLACGTHFIVATDMRMHHLRMCSCMKICIVILFGCKHRLSWHMELKATGSYKFLDR